MNKRRSNNEMDGLATKRPNTGVIVSNEEYGDSVFPLVNGGIIHLLVGGDVVNIILSYCDKSVVSWTELHSVPPHNPLLVDQLATTFTELTASNVLHTPAVAANTKTPDSNFNPLDYIELRSDGYAIVRGGLSDEQWAACETAIAELVNDDDDSQMSPLPKAGS